MENTQVKAWGLLAKRCALGAGDLVAEMLSRPLEVMYKSSASDLVTSVDRAVEQFVIDKIIKAYPDHGILGEEGLIACKPSEFDTVWMVDPIDGTTNFVHQQQNYCISIAVYHKGVCEAGVVYDPTRKEMFYAERGGGLFLNDMPIQVERNKEMKEALLSTGLFWNRRAMKSGLSEKAQRLAHRSRGVRVYGVAALELAYVAVGRLDGYINLNLNPWDYGAGRLLVEEAGGRITTLEGGEIPFAERSSILAANPYIYDFLLEFLAETPV
ncbi:inositol monophosphatase family protein [Aneurinibacillus sp. REN35]|uniref:inositol monophosphatase family protein n=1 Tax=Aneurinibacillus sp. REN35 TaxID=3237286 RepID=UPI0035289005